MHDRYFAASWAALLHHAHGVNLNLFGYNLQRMVLHEHALPSVPNALICPGTACPLQSIPQTGLPYDHAIFFSCPSEYISRFLNPRIPFQAFFSWKCDLFPMLKPIVPAQPHEQKDNEDRYAESREAEA